MIQVVRAIVYATNAPVDIGGDYAPQSMSRPPPRCSMGRYSSP